jgi:hypothetical protein
MRMELINNLPFLTIAQYMDTQIVGIMQNQDTALTSIYIYDEIRTDAHRKEFLDCGAEWWWETNRLIPINIILGKRFSIFKTCLKTYNTKEFTIISGPNVCLRDMLNKRTKKRQIQLINKL